MSKRQLIKTEVLALYKDGMDSVTKLQKDGKGDFRHEYQIWYTKALRVVQALAPDRIAEFRGFYEIDTKRKTLGYGTYVIQDFIKGVAPAHRPEFNTTEQTATCFYNQLTILYAIAERIDSVIGDIEGELYAELQDNEILVAKQLAKISLRAAGALMGVVIEGHLQNVADKHGIKVGKKNPTIADINDPLKSASIIDTPTWRKISFLADIRNLCSHKKDADPTKEQVEELISGAEWLTKC